MLTCVLLAAACSKTEAPAATPPTPAATAPTPAATATPPTAAAAVTPPNGVPTPEQLAQLQKQALGAAGVAQQKPAVNWRALTPLLTDTLGGWKARADAKGQTTARDCHASVDRTLLSFNAELEISND